MRSVLRLPPAIDLTDPMRPGSITGPSRLGCLFSLRTLEFLLTLNSISPTLVPNKQKIGGKNYLNKPPAVESYIAKKSKPLSVVIRVSYETTKRSFLPLFPTK